MRRVVAEYTKIPIPEVIGYQLGEPTDGPLSSFLILEYVGGRQLTDRELKNFTIDQRQRFYGGLANFFTQLRDCQSFTIGSLSSEHVSTKPIVMISTNTAELEGLKPYEDYEEYFQNNNPLESANEYTTMRQKYVDRAFSISPATVREGSEGAKNHFLNVCFGRNVDRFKDDQEDLCPFVLVHGDFEPKNILVNDTGEIVSVIDWEFSRVVPLRYFLPPFWLHIPFGIRQLSQPLFYDSWLRQFQDLLRVMKAQEIVLPGLSTLHDEWLDAIQDSSRFLIASALENWTEARGVADAFVSQSLSHGYDFPKSLERWMKESDHHESTLIIESNYAKRHATL